MSTKQLTSENRAASDEVITPSFTDEEIKVLRANRQSVIKLLLKSRDLYLQRRELSIEAARPERLVNIFSQLFSYWQKSSRARTEQKPH